MRHGPAAPAPGASVGRRACLCPVSEHAADSSDSHEAHVRDDPKQGGAARGVSLVGYALVRMPHLYGSVRVPFTSSFLRIRLRASVPAFPARSGRRSSEFGLRFAAGLAMGRGRRRVVGRRDSRSAVRGGMLTACSAIAPSARAARPHVMGRGGHVDTLLALYATRRSHEFSPVFTSRHLVNATQRRAAPHWHALSHAVHRQHRTERLNPEAA